MLKHNKVRSVLGLVLFAFILLPNIQSRHVQSTFELNQYNDFESISEGFRLIQTSEESPPEWMSQGEILTLFRNNIKFMDVTDFLDLGTHLKTTLKHVYPAVPLFQDEVNGFIRNLTTTTIHENLVKFTSFHNRYYRSSYGEQSSKWLYSQIFDIIQDANDANLDVDVSVRKFTHSWAQKSIIARFEGSDPEKQNQVVIVGAHQDSINMWLPAFGRAPGADDDGSGTVTILEAFRVLVAGQFRPVRPVEFHWYSAEEAGLLGSQAIALEYEKEGKDVVGMIQNDMTGYVGKNKESFGIVVDFVDEDLTTFLKKLVGAYTEIPFTETKCGYACSDHASWRKAGFPSAFAIESEFSDSNPHIHSTNDIVDHLSFEHMLEFSKVGFCFLIFGEKSYDTD
ncbi:9254_t:CDS:2 [Funneliformis caledonium]|uniref:Peptide hydrolase n=1 Tax=Funneliformis caledonium TaxID=1117310 RepID=A0A9N9G440_9GLOM|nr:9254_t:CDS:2 [Funneliformis caledonium]